MIWNLLDSATSSESSAATKGNPYTMWIIIGVLFAIVAVYMVLSNRSAKKRQQEAKNLLDSVKVGAKVKTIGGICGKVVEIDKNDGSFLLETGDDKHGKSYLKFVKEAIYTTDEIEAQKQAQAQAKSAPEKSAESKSETKAKPSAKKEAETPAEENDDPLAKFDQKE